MCSYWVLFRGAVYKQFRLKQAEEGSRSRQKETRFDRFAPETLIKLDISNEYFENVGKGVLIKTNKMHFSFLIYSNNLSSTFFEQNNYSSSGGSYCICIIWYIPC
jgi:hypothetical protein